MQNPLKLYLPICLFGHGFKHLLVSNDNKMCVKGVLGKNMINTLACSCFVDKTADLFT